MPIIRNLKSLVVNKVESQEVYNYMVANNLINEDEIYLTDYNKDITAEDIPMSTSDNTSIAAKLSKAISHMPQTLTEEQKAQARINIGAKSNIQSDWLQNDSLAEDYIKNRPFYEIETPIYNNTLQYDTESQIHVDFIDGLLFKDNCFYKIIVNDKEFVAPCYYISKDEYFIIGDNIYNDDINIKFGVSILAMPYMENVFYLAVMLLNNDGTPIINESDYAIEINELAIEKIPERFLPEVQNAESECNVVYVQVPEIYLEWDNSIFESINNYYLSGKVVYLRNNINNILGLVASVHYTSLDDISILIFSKDIDHSVCIKRNNAIFNNEDLYIEIPLNNLTLPYASVDDNGKFLGITDGKWAFTDNPVPSATTSDNGKFLRVVDGVPAWSIVPNAEEASF